MKTVYVPGDASAVSVGADDVAAAFAELDDVRVVRTGSRGLLWCEPLVEVDPVETDTADGRVGWASPLPAYNDPKDQTGPLTWFGPVLAGDRLVVAGTSAQALAVSPYTGRILGRQRLPASAAPVQPAVADGTVLLVAEDGRLIALR